MKVFRYRWFNIPLIGLIIVIIISMVINDLELVNVVLFLKKTLPVILLFIYLVINATKVRLSKYFIYFVFWLIGLQLFAGFYKIITYGPAEEFIGIMSVGEGSLTTFFGLLLFSFFLINFMIKRNLVSILGMAMTILFIISGGKRAPIVYIPIISMLIVLLYQYHYIAKKIRVLPVVFAVTISAASLLVLLIFNESLNPQKKTFGDLDFAIEYIQNYNAYEGKKGIEGYGRATAPRAVFNTLTSKETSNFLFGMGPGVVIASSLKSDIYGTSDKEIFANVYGLGYGSRIGFLWIGFQIGLVGLILYIALYYIFFRKLVYSALKNLPKNLNAYALIMLKTIPIVFLLDFLTYSQVMLKLNGTTLIAFFLIYYSFDIPHLHEQSGSGKSIRS
jgi:hypothetical protein